MPPPNKNLVIFIDDINMPHLDSYGSIPVIELLREFLERNGFYNRKNKVWNKVTSSFICTCG